MPTITFLDAISKIVVIALVSKHLTKKRYQDVQLEHLIKFHHNQLKNARENQAKGFCIALTLVTPSQSQGHWKWYKMLKVDGAYKQGWYKNINWKVHAECPVLKFLPRKTHNQPDRRKGPIA